MNPELQKANDMLVAMQAQRDHALNGLVLMQAELAAQRRENDALRSAQTNVVLAESGDTLTSPDGSTVLSGCGRNG